MLSRVLLFVHAGLAKAVHPVMEIDPEESSMLAAPMVDVMDQFGLKPDPKYEAIVGLITAASMVYGPRIYMMSRSKQEKPMKNVTPQPSANGHDPNPPEGFMGMMATEPVH